MDVKLENLIEKIKKDGIDQAEKESQTIIDKANEQATSIIEEAKKKAKEVVGEGEKEAEKLRKNAEKSIQQSARDLTLVLKEQLVALAEKLLKGKISQELSPNFLKELIVKIVQNWTSEKKQTLEALVNEKDKKKLEELLSSELKEQAKGVIEIKVSKAVEKGFRIGIKGQDVYYDFTDESFLEALKEFVSPSLAAILDANNG